MIQTFLITWVTHNARISERMRIYEDKIVEDREKNPQLGSGKPVEFTTQEEREIMQYLAEIIHADNLVVLAKNICSDHVHLVMVCEEMELMSIVRKLKSFSSRKYNIAHGFTVSDKGACSLAQEHDTDSVSNQSKGASSLVGARGKSQSQLWAQKYNTVILPDERSVQNACHYVYYNRQKHHLPKDEILENIIQSAVTHHHDIR